VCPHYVLYLQLNKDEKSLAKKEEEKGGWWLVAAALAAESGFQGVG